MRGLFLAPAPASRRAGNWEQSRHFRRLAPRFFITGRVTMRMISGRNLAILAAAMLAMPGAGLAQSAEVNDQVEDVAEQTEELQRETNELNQAVREERGDVADETNREAARDARDGDDDDDGGKLGLIGLLGLLGLAGLRGAKRRDDDRVHVRGDGSRPGDRL